MSKDKLDQKEWLRRSISIGFTIASNKGRIKAILDRFYDRNEKKLKVEGIGNKINSLGRMLKAYFKGEYKDVSPWLFVNTGVGLLYLIINADLIPDKVYDLGFLDDLAVLIWVVDTYAEEIEKFEYWEAKQLIRNVQIA